MVWFHDNGIVLLFRGIFQRTYEAYDIYQPVLPGSFAYLLQYYS